MNLIYCALGLLIIWDFNCFFLSPNYLLDQEDIAEEDERLVEAFLSKDAGPQHTLADLIVKKIKENDAVVSSGLVMFKCLSKCQLCDTF